MATFKKSLPQIQSELSEIFKAVTWCYYNGYSGNLIYVFSCNCKHDKNIFCVLWFL